MCDAEVFAPLDEASKEVDIPSSKESASQMLSSPPSATDADGHDDMGFAERVALCGLLCEALDHDSTLCDVVVGLLLPPPWLSPPPSPRDERRAGVLRYGSQLSQTWRDMIVMMPLHLALQSGTYDARLRVAMRRLCHVFGMSFDEMVLPKESQISALDLDDLKGNEVRLGMRGVVVARKEKRKYSAARVAAVGAFAVVGGAALVLTGGLAAPVIGPAFAALVGATTTTLGVVSSVGSAVLGGGALAAAFAAVIGIATHAAAAAALLAPYLTAANLTAIFGVSGAGLAGYKGIRRTAESSTFLIRGVDDIEDLPPLHHLAVEDVEQLRTLSISAPTSSTAGDAGHAPVAAAAASVASALPIAKVADMLHDVHSHQTSDYSDDIFSRSLSGLVVPHYTVNVTLRNIAKSETVEKRSRSNVFALENHLPLTSLELRGLKLDVGVWAHVPPRTIPFEYAGIAASHNKVARPTGAGGFLCYEIICGDLPPVTHHRRSAATTTAALLPATERGPRIPSDVRSRLQSLLHGVRLWVLTRTTITNTPYLSVLLEPASSTATRDGICRKLESDEVSERAVLFASAVALSVELAFEPQPRIRLLLHDRIAKLLPAAVESLRGSFPHRELTQRVEDGKMALNSKRRVLCVVVQNKSKRDAVRVAVCSVQCLAGVPGATTDASLPMPSVINAGESSAAFFTNKDFAIIDGAEAVFVMEVSRQEQCPSGSVTDSGTWACRLHATANAIGKYKASCFFSCGPSKLLPVQSPQSSTRISGTTAKRVPVASLLDAEDAHPLTSFVATLSVDETQGIVELVIGDASDAQSICTTSAHRMSMTIGVCGFMEVLDPRRLLQDQQIALWQPVLNSHRLFRGSQGLVAVWEEAYLKRFSQTVGLLRSETLVNRATQEVLSTGKKHVKQQLLQGAVFAGLRALDAFKGTFALPLYAVMAADLIDNTFATLANRADYAGKDLATAILSESRGSRPVSLVGFSFGAAVIAHCLHELHAVGAIGIIENVFLLGGVVPSDRGLWTEIRRVAAGRVVNVYHRSDWMLWTMHKANALQVKPLAGLAPIHGVMGVENIDASALIDSHASYAIKLDAILDLIPADFPTCRTLHPDDDAGSPGALVPSGEVDTACQRLFSSMTIPFIKEDKVCVVGLVNRVCGNGAFRDDLVLVAAHVNSGCTFDFTPVDRISTGFGGVCGVMQACTAGTVDASADSVPLTPVVCGVLGYCIDLQPLKRAVVLVMIFFAWDDANSDMKANAVALLAPLEPHEAHSDTWKQRLAEVVRHHATSVEEIVGIACNPPVVNVKDNEDEDSEVCREFHVFDETDGHHAASGAPWMLRMRCESSSGYVVTVQSQPPPTHLLTQLVSSRDPSTTTFDAADGSWAVVKHCADASAPLLELPEVADCVMSACQQAFPLRELLWGSSALVPFPPTPTEECLSSSSTCVLVPFIIANATPSALTHLASDVVPALDGCGSSSCVRDAFWVRSPPGVLPPQSVSVAVVRLTITDSSTSSSQNSCPLLVTYRSDEAALAFHVLIKCCCKQASSHDAPCSSCNRHHHQHFVEVDATGDGGSALVTQYSTDGFKLPTVYFAMEHDAPRHEEAVVCEPPQAVNKHDTNNDDDDEANRRWMEFV